MSRSVCIVGAGPAGLVAAKTLLHDVDPDRFKVTIYDVQSRVGGLWPNGREDGGGIVHPLMVTNQSKHTVQFSDLAWHHDAPQFPRAWMVGQYLERYSERYNGGADIRLGHRVVQTELQSGGSWKVTVESDKGRESSVFDRLLVTSGHFGKPIWPDFVPDKAEMAVLHSSKYRDLKSMLGQSKGGGGKIVIVGGQMSGCEIATTIALHLSSEVNSAGSKSIQDPDLYSIHQVLPRPGWIVPLFISADAAAAAPPFLPLDLPSYNLAGRAQPLENNAGHVSFEAAAKLNSFYHSTLGSDQAEFSGHLRISGDRLQEPPFVAVSSQYGDMVRSGLIRLSPGRVSALSGTTVTLSPSGETMTDVAAVVLATGFEAAPSYAFLPAEVLDGISYAPSHRDIPAALAFHGTHHPSFPTLGFVGMYRSPYWGVMEMQARFITRLWTASPQSAALEAALQADETIERMLALRSDRRVSQYPMGDYAFLMHDFAKALDLTISPPRPLPPSGNGNRPDLLTPARFISSNATDAQLAEVERNVVATHETALAGLSAGKFVAGAVFRSLLGEWKLERDIVSKLPTQPTGRFVGTARFLLRQGTTELGNGAGQGDAGLEYLYVEDGEFTATNGLAFGATRRYVWRYDDVSDLLSLWFVKTDDHITVDYLFHHLRFFVSDDGSHCGWQAKASSHLCVQDVYDVHYAFDFEAVNLRGWKTRSVVRGPKKDYTISSAYRR